MFNAMGGISDMIPNCFDPAIWMCHCKFPGKGHRDWNNNIEQNDALLKLLRSLVARVLMARFQRLFRTRS